MQYHVEILGYMTVDADSYDEAMDKISQVTISSMDQGDIKISSEQDEDDGEGTAIWYW